MIKQWKRWYPIEKWYDNYKEYQKFDDRVVKVKEIYKNSFKMEVIHGDILSQIVIDNHLDRDVKLHITRQVLDIINNMFQFKPKLGHFFWHDDSQLKNFMLEPDFKVRLIDPDSFMTINFDNTSHSDFEMGKIINSFYRLKGSLIND
tara:strand:+ start:738 stop:1178 length:441 start_codon:yes stop_codon:yes gene_type:complete